LANFKPLNGRGAIHFFPNYNINLIDESYNASPASMIASLKAAALMKKNNQRIIAIIGDMRELGHSEIQMHENLANHIITHNIDQVYTVGKLSKYLFDILPDNIAAAHFDATDEIAEVVQSVVRNGDIILIKSSNSVNTKLVVADLVNHFGS
jgi:UDP-N-acetylmuramoyl-tripeptide--D-alanyl-D-alanine ligase